jgi:molybdopterin synthase catalytic subunit
MTTTIRLQREAFDVATETALLTRVRTDIGAVVTFTGLCRADENGEPIAALTLEHYPDMAEAEIARHVEEARARWPLLGVTVIHRYGRIAPGEGIVLVVSASSHREAAFAAASFLMDYLKTRARRSGSKSKRFPAKSGSTPRPPTMPPPSAGRRHRRGAKRRNSALDTGRPMESRTAWRLQIAHGRATGRCPAKCGR